MNETTIETEDDFFGDQSEDFQDTTCEYRNNEHNHHDHHHHHHHDHGSLAKHETQAQHENHRNIGYHEAYDEFKEVKLQEGFEAGYRQYILEAKKLGMLLGRCVGAGAGGAGAGAGAPDAVAIVREYLVKAQSTSESKNESGEKQQEVDEEDGDITAVIERLEKMLG